MPGAYIDFEAVQKDKEVQRLLSEMLRKGRDLGPALKKIRAMEYGSIKETFRRQGRPARWKGLAPLTIALRRKGKGKGSPRILQDTGQLFTSVTSPHAAHSVNRITPTMLVMGTRREGAVHHQRGRQPHDETWQIEKHSRGPYMRSDGIKVKQHSVRAHSKVMHFGKTPKREFLKWRPEDIEKVKKILVEELTEGTGAGVFAKVPTGPGVLSGRA